MVDVLASVSRAAELEVEIRSAHGPHVRWGGTRDVAAAVDAAASSSSSGGGLELGKRIRRWFLEWLRPEVWVRTAFGTVHKAPGGPAPATSSWPLVPVVAGVALLVVLVLAVVGAVSVVRSFARR